MIKENNLTIEELLRETEHNILRIKKRFYYTKKFLEEVAKVTEGKRFEIRNDIIWQMLVDSYEMLIIDLASLYRGMCQPSGFFGLLKQFSSELREKSYRKIDIGEPNIVGPHSDMNLQEQNALQCSVKLDLQKLVAKNIEEALFELFPELKKEKQKKANHKLIDALKDRFWTIAKEVIQDRDNFRAHRYECKQDVITKKDEMTLEKLEKQFEILQKTISNIRLIATNSSFGYTDMNYANKDRTSGDIVDLIMIGSINQIMNQFGIPDKIKAGNQSPWFYYQYRTEFYARNPAPFGLPEKVKKCDGRNNVEDE